MTDINNSTNQGGDVEMRQPADLIGSHHSHVGPILGVLVIMLVLILGGLYLWGGMLSREAGVTDTREIINNEPETPRAVADQEILGTVSPSDELDAIEADISSMMIDGLDAELTAIDAELNAALAE